MSDTNPFEVSRRIFMTGLASLAGALHMESLLSRIVGAQVSAAMGSLSTPEKSGVEEHYEVWLRRNFPHVASAPLAARHHRLWRWAEALKPGIKPPANIEVWPRGGAKSSTGELIVARLSQTLQRSYVLIICGTQKQADKHIKAVGNRLSEMNVSRKVDRNGQTRGWRRDELITNMGFGVTGMGLDVAVRGIKMDWHRPGLIIFDDVDDRKDTPETRAKKMVAIQENILPAGSNDCAVLFLQNLITEDSIVSQLHDGRAQFLLNRIVSPVEVAIEGLKYEIVEGEDGRNRFKITEGEATWAGQSIQTCEDQMNEWGLNSFLRESQQMVRGSDGFYFATSNIETIPASMLEKRTRLLKLVLVWDLAATEMAGDYTAYVLMGIGIDGKIYVLDARREQYASHKVKNMVHATSLRYTATYGDKLTILFKQDPGQAGKDQKDNYFTLLHGMNVKFKPETGSKAVKNQIWADVMQGKNAVLIEGDWNPPFIDEHRLFREDESHERDDFCDCAGGGASFLVVGRSVLTSQPIRAVRAPEPHSGQFVNLGYQNGLIIPR